MGTERFDIEVRDVVAKTIRTELKAIGTEARSTYGLVQQLNRELAAGTSSAATSAQTAASKASSAAGQTAAAQAKATAESARAAAQAARTEAAVRKANVAYLQEEAALNRAVAAEQRAISSKKQMAAATDQATEAQRRQTRIVMPNENPAYKTRPAGYTLPPLPVGGGPMAGISASALAGSAGGTAQEAKEMERFAQSVKRLRDELDPAAASAAKFAMQHDVLNRALETGIMTAAEHKVATKALTLAEEEAAKAFLKTGSGAHLGAGQVREMIVVMRELARGDMTRLPGSLTILAQRFNLLNSLSIGMVAGFGAVAAVTVLLVAAMAAGEAESNKLANTLSLSGNAAGITSTKFEEMAETISKSTHTSVGSNKELLLSIAGNASFTSDEMGKLVTASQELARATGQSANDVLADFVKMADGPTQYAEKFYNQYSGVIAPTLVDHIRQLEATGQTYEATKALVDGLTKGLAQNQVEQTGVIIRAWHAVENAVSSAWDALKGIGASESTAQALAGVNDKIARLSSGQLSHRPLESMSELLTQQALLQRQIVDEQKAAEATAQHTREQRLQEQGVQALAGTYGHLVDNHYRYTNDVAKLQNAMRNAVGWGSVGDPSVHFEEVLAKAAKSNDKNVQNMASNWNAALDKLRKQDMPAQWKADNKHSRKGRQPWDRDQNFQNDNEALDAQIGLLDKYGDELERAQQLEQVSKKYRDHNVALTEAETASLQKKYQTLQEGRRVQEAMTAADEAANGASRKYDDTITALNELLSRGVITQEQYNEQLNMASRAFEDATDPLASLNRELQRNGELMGKYGRDRDVAQYIQQLQQAAEAKGKSIYQPGTKSDPNEIGAAAQTGKLTDQAQSMVDQYRKQQKQAEYTQYFESIDPRQKQDPTGSAYVLDHQRELYAEIQRFRDEDVANEAEATERKKNLDKAYLDARLESASSMFGQLSQLQNSKNKEVAALGKAAAIAQATIDGYRAVQAALAGPPGPPWSFAIAGVTAAMTVANVARIAGVGFQRGGYTGDGNSGDVAGPAHRQEFIFDAAATRRLGVPALEALRSGRTFTPSQNDNSAGPRVSIYPQAGVYMEEVSTSDDHIEMIAKRVVRRDAPKVAADDIKRGANGSMGKALGGAYGLKRQDR